MSNTNKDFSQIVDRGYGAIISFYLYNEQNKPHVLQVLDAVGALVGEPGREAIIVVGEIEIVTLGQEDVAPAHIRVKLTAADTLLLSQGVAYQLDLWLLNTTDDLLLLSSGTLSVRDTVQTPIEI